MKGLDVSFSKITPQWAANRKAEGYEVFVQCAWTGGLAGNPGIQQVCAHNLKCAREAGMIACIYVNASPPDWFSVSVQVDNIKRNCGSEWDHLKYVFMDVEIAGTTYERAMVLAGAMTLEGKECNTLYSARWFWNTLPNPKDPRWYATFPTLWNAYYDNDPDIDFSGSPYGLWKLHDLMGEQYQNTTTLEGVSVDLNQFTNSYFQQEDTLALTPEAEKMLNELAVPYQASGQTFPSALHFMLAQTTAFDLHRQKWVWGEQNYSQLSPLDAFKQAVREVLAEQETGSGDGSHHHG